MNEVIKRHNDEIEFFTVYVKEAHPIDGWDMPGNQQQIGQIKQPRNFDDREFIAEQCQSVLKFDCPTLVDRLDNQIVDAYAAFPDRLFIVDKQGKLVYKGGRGPFGYKPLEMEQVLAMTMMAEKLESTDETKE